MKRETRYLVVKYRDILKHLSEADQMALMALVTKVEVGRHSEGKKTIECVVVEHDWPEYLDVWSMIAARVDGVGGFKARMQQFIDYDPAYAAPDAEVKKS